MLQGLDRATLLVSFEHVFWNDKEVWVEDGVTILLCVDGLHDLASGDILPVVRHSVDELSDVVGVFEDRAVELTVGHEVVPLPVRRSAGRLVLRFAGKPLLVELMYDVGDPKPAV